MLKVIFPMQSCRPLQQNYRDFGPTLASEALRERHDKYRAVPGLDLTLHKEGSVKASMIEMESEIMKLPSEEQGAAYQEFNATMRKLLTVPPEVWQAALEHAKRLKDAGRRGKARGSETEAQQ